MASRSPSCGDASPLLRPGLAFGAVAAIGADAIDTRRFPKLAHLLLLPEEQALLKELKDDKDRRAFQASSGRAVIRARARRPTSSRTTCASPGRTRDELFAYPNEKGSETGCGQVIALLGPPEEVRVAGEPSPTPPPNADPTTARGAGRTFDNMAYLREGPNAQPGDLGLPRPAAAALPLHGRRAAHGLRPGVPLRRGRDRRRRPEARRRGARDAARARVRARCRRPPPPARGSDRRAGSQLRSDGRRPCASGPPAHRLPARRRAQARDADGQGRDVRSGAGRRRRPRPAPRRHSSRRRRGEGRRRAERGHDVQRGEARRARTARWSARGACRSSPGATSSRWRRSSRTKARSRASTLEVPDFGGAALAASPLVAYPDEPQAASASDRRPTPLSARADAPPAPVRQRVRSDRTRSWSSPRSTARSWTPRPARRRCKARYSILKDGKPVARGAEDVFATADAVASVGPIPLAAYAPGSYVVRLDVTDTVAGESLQREASFEIRRP